MKSAFLVIVLVCAWDCGTGPGNMPVLHHGKDRVLTEEARIEYFYLEFELSSVVKTELFKLELIKGLDRALRKLLNRANGIVKIEDQANCGLPTEDLDKEFAGVALIVYITNGEASEGNTVRACSEHVVLITVNGDTFDWEGKTELLRMVDHAVQRS